jgi:hypothetical protein
LKKQSRHMGSRLGNNKGERWAIWKTGHDISVWVHRAERNEQLGSLDGRKVIPKVNHALHRAYRPEVGPQTSTTTESR